MASRADLFRKAGDLIEVLQAIDRFYFITAENGKIYLSQDNETWSPKIQVWPEEEDE